MCVYTENARVAVHAASVYDDCFFCLHVLLIVILSGLSALCESRSNTLLYANQTLCCVFILSFTVVHCMVKKEMCLQGI